MVRRSRARYLAPLALAATITGTYLIVHSALTSKSTTTSALQTRALQHAPVRGRLARAKFYVVHPGDTLSSIAFKTGVSVATLEALNPSIVDPNTLQASQRLRLRR